MVNGSERITHTHTAGRYGTRRPLKAKLFIGVMLFLTFIWTGSVAWLALLITLLITGYAYLSRRDVGWQWAVLPAALNVYWVLALVV